MRVLYRRLRHFPVHAFVIALGGALFAFHELIYLWAQKNIEGGKNMEKVKALVFHGVSESGI
jgi:hypothetical protein